MGRNREAISTRKPAEPPAELSAAAQELWRQAVSRKGFDTLTRLATLRQALLAFDRAEQARLAVNADGMLTVTKRSGVAHLNPLLKVEKESRQAFMQAWEALGLNRTWDV